MEEEDSRLKKTIAKQWKKTSDKMVKNWEKYLACVCSFLLSIAGGAVLVFWEVKFHPTNSQLWMVPVGLILVATPPFIWVSSIFSDFLCCNTVRGCGGGRSAGDGEEGGRVGA